MTLHSGFGFVPPSSTLTSAGMTHKDFSPLCFCPIPTHCSNLTHNPFPPLSCGLLIDTWIFFIDRLLLTAIELVYTCLCSSSLQNTSFYPVDFVILWGRFHCKSVICLSFHCSQDGRFCTNETHNPWAPTPQNVMCGGRSVWEVLEAHPDFKASGCVLTQTHSWGCFFIH